MKMTRLPLLFCPLLACSPAQATMTMRVFAPDGGAARMVRLEAPSPNRTPPSVAEGAITLEMSVFPTAPGQAMRRVALEGLAAANAASGEPTAPIPGRAGAEALKLRLEAGLAARRDDLRWNIADGDGMPDVLSELTWREQKSLVLNARGEAEWPSGWLLAAEVGAGTLLKGEIQDSDYDGDGRAQEWSRTVGESDDAGLLDLTLSGGHRFRFGPHAVTASVGYAWHEQNLRSGLLTQAISEPNSFGVLPPPKGTRFDARSSYTARWRGPRLALGLDLALAGGWGMNLGAWREWVDYKGTGNWALREELAHPESFTHLADGRVTGLGVGLGRSWRKNGRLSLAWEKVKGRAGPGTDTTHLVDGGDLSTRLNEVVWDSESLRLGLQWAF